MPRKNAERKTQKIEKTEKALNAISAPVASREYVKRAQTILENSKLPQKSRIELEIKYHVPRSVTLPTFPNLSLLQQQLLGKAMLEQLLGFELTEQKHRAAGAATSLAEWCAYGYTLYTAIYDRLRDLASESTLVEQEKQSLLLRAGPDSPNARAEVNQYLNHNARVPGIYAGAEYYQKDDNFGLISFLIAMPKPLLGKILLAAMAHMLDSVTQLALDETAKTAANDKLENIPFGRCEHGDLGHLLFADPNLNYFKSNARVVSFPVLPEEFVRQFYTIIKELPKELQVGDQDSNCRLGPIYHKYYDHLGRVQSNYGIDRRMMTMEALARLDRLPLAEFHLEKMLNAFFAILQTAQEHLLRHEEVIAAQEKTSSGVESSSSSSSALPLGVSAGQLAAAYASPLPPAEAKEMDKANSEGVAFKK
jgi:hypothetical protein